MKYNSIGKESFIVHIVAMGPNGEDFYAQFDLDLEVTLNQSGFPYDSDGTVQSSPLIMDLNQDSNVEIIYGDNNGVINILDANGNSVFNEFPYINVYAYIIYSIYNSICVYVHVCRFIYIVFKKYKAANSHPPHTHIFIYVFEFT